MSSYREYPSGDRHIACLWTRRAGPRSHQLVVPDGCVDIMWSSEGTLLVAGPDTAPWTAELPAGSTLAGVRLRPGVAPAVLRAPAPELRDRRVALEDMWGAQARALASELEASEFQASELEASEPALPVHDLLRRAVIDRLETSAPDPLVQHTVRALHSGAATVGALAADMGIGARQLHRRCTLALGYGPKLLDRVLRFQRFLRLLGTPAESAGLAGLAAEAGYADQAHLTRECRELAGATPKRLSETFNTSEPASA